MKSLHNYFRNKINFMAMIYVGLIVVAVFVKQ